MNHVNAQHWISYKFVFTQVTITRELLNHIEISLELTVNVDNKIACKIRATFFTIVRAGYKIKKLNLDFPMHMVVPKTYMNIFYFIATPLIFQFWPSLGHICPCGMTKNHWVKKYFVQKSSQNWMGIFFACGVHGPCTEFYASQMSNKYVLGVRKIFLKF